MKLRTNILLNQNEKMVLNKIQAYAITLINVTPRVAGGWVRDKLLGKDSNDIDITVDKITGVEFANGLRTFYGWTGPVGKIKANPDRSKHLETTVMRINGISIDFLSLRKEEYENTRIPKTISCTAEEDAFRRDLTINSLFYNLITEKVEDFTGFGLEDLKNGLLRTPLEPYKTLVDDPLRLLRIIRFSVRFNFQIDNDLLSAFSEKEIQEHLSRKISAERIKSEIFKILESERFVNAFKIFCVSGLFQAIFKCDFNIDTSDLARVYQNYTIFKKYLNVDCPLVRFYVLLIFNGVSFDNGAFKNYIVAKNILCCNKKFFLAVKQMEKNLMLLKKVSEKMSDFDAVFLLRHMQTDFESSLVVYLMAGEYTRVEIHDYYKNIGIEHFNFLIDQNHNQLRTDNVGQSTVEDYTIEEAVNRNKYLIFYLMNCAKKYKTELFPRKFPFDGVTITKWLNIETYETSFYLEMAKVEFIVNKTPLDQMPDKLTQIKNDNRIENFKLFYLTSRF